MNFRLKFQFVLLCSLERLWNYVVVADELPTCQAHNFHYEFTECDSQGGRWRVSVPNPGECTGGAPNAPVRIQNCTMPCDRGSYFNLTTLECDKCPIGTYSLGGGVAFDTWDELPPGFHVITENFQTSFHTLSRFVDNENVNCSKYGWQPHGEYITSVGSPCSSTLVYTVKLVKPGKLIYTYQYTDDSVIFQFQAQNDQCQSIAEAEDNRWPRITEEGKWAEIIVSLKTGLNVLQWKTIGISIDNERRSKPIAIKSIAISGVAYTSACTPCMNGTYNTKQGESECLECPENTFSVKGMKRCEKCNASQYSFKGADKCINRLPCTVSDYFVTHSPCDSKKQTLESYQWIEPKICSEELATSVSLPSKKRIPCPSCNPGMHYSSSNSSGCSFCPENFYSDGHGVCQSCPATTAPNYGYQFIYWNEIPPGMEASCMSVDGTGCRTSNGWQVAGNHIHSGFGHAADVYLVLTLQVPGFQSRDGFINGQPIEVGKIEFNFEVDCVNNCEFVFMQGSTSRGASVIKNWQGSQPKQHFSYSITQNDSYIFTWAFQKVQWEHGIPKIISTQSNLRDTDSSVAKIFSVNVTNTINGGASRCLPCPRGTQKNGCIPCTPGFYVDSNSTKCLKCPANTFVLDPMPYGIEACKPCGSGLKSDDGQTCYSDCSFSDDKRFYDLQPLSGFHIVKGNQLFTSSGTKYYHLFNISLCGTKGLPYTTCTNNVSYHGITPFKSETIKSLVCRSTVVPENGFETKTSFVAQSVSLGDHLLGVSTKTTLNNITVLPSLLGPYDKHQRDLHFFYTSPILTKACMNGRTTTITLRCNSTQTGTDSVLLPPTCPDGTCDGCNFHFLWLTKYACPTCTEKDYEIVKGDCIGGVQKVHYMAQPYCLLPKELSKSGIQRACSAIPRELQIIIGLAALLSVLLIALVCYFWKKNQKLTYKYMKLVQSSSSKDGELPPAESCALNDDEEDHYDRVHYKESKGKGLFGKMKSMTGTKTDSNNPFETIQLTGKDNIS